MKPAKVIVFRLLVAKSHLRFPTVSEFFSCNCLCDEYVWSDGICIICKASCIART